MIFKQADPRWGEKELGHSGLKMNNYGCLVTAVAQALFQAGYEFVNPGEVVDGLNSVGGFTNDQHPQGAGLLIWAKITEVYPQFKFGGQGYDFVAGDWGEYPHWVLKTAGQIFDPLFGENKEPDGFKENGVIRSASIEPSQITIPVEPQEPAPVAQAPATAQELSSYTVVSGDTLGQIVLDHYGDGVSEQLWGDAGLVNKIARFNGITNSNRIFPGQVIKFPQS